MSTSSATRRWTSYLFEIAASVTIAGVVAPLLGCIAFVVIFGAPVYIFDQPPRSMVAWGWVTTPLAMLCAPAVAIGAAFLLLRQVTQQGLYYVIGAAVAYSMIVKTTQFKNFLSIVFDWFN